MDEPKVMHGPHTLGDVAEHLHDGEEVGLDVCPAPMGIQCCPVYCYCTVPQWLVRNRDFERWIFTIEKLKMSKSN